MCACVLFIHTSWPSCSRTSQYLPFTHTHHTSCMCARPCLSVCVCVRARVCVSLLACLLRDNFCLNATAACQPSLGCASHPHTRFAVLCRHADLHVCVTVVHIHQAFPSPLPLSGSIPRFSHVHIILPGTRRPTTTRRTCRQVCCRWGSGPTWVGLDLTLPPGVTRAHVDGGLLFPA